jgi:simple sugar transport system permease protein
MAGLIGLVIGALIMLAFGYNPIAAYISLFSGSFGKRIQLGRIPRQCHPAYSYGNDLCHCHARLAFSTLVPKVKLYIGALAAVAVSLIDLPFPLNAVAALGAAIVAGMLWSLPVALLKLTRGVHEVISTIMLNWIAHFFAFYLIANVLTDPKRGEKTISIIESARLARILPGTSLNYGLVIALIAVAAILFLLWRTSAGFEMRASGYNQEATHYAGISLRKQVLRVFLIGGAIAGLAGAVQVMGRPPTYAVMSGLPQLMNLGFDGIGVAMIGRNHPVGIVFAAIFFGGLMVGGRIMQFSPGVPLELVRVVEGVIIITLAIPELRRLFTFFLAKFKRGA